MKNSLEHPNVEELLTEMDRLTRLGHRASVLQRLERVLREDPSRRLRPALARIANRNHAYVLALRILHQIIRDDREGVAQASPEALNVYATTLMWIGSTEEAEECLARAKGLTDATLSRAFLYFTSWEYHKALPYLKRYIDSPEISPYQRYVGQINLLSALIATGQLAQARNQSLELREALKRDVNYQLLYGNCLELHSQIEICEGHLGAAVQILDESEKVLAHQGGRYLLYVQKWRAVANLALAPNQKDAMASLMGVRGMAQGQKNWETIRDCDFHLARLTQNGQLMQRHLLGTPYKGYHQRAQDLFGIGLSEDRNLVFCPGHPVSEPHTIGLNIEKISDPFFLGSRLLPLLQIVTKDIYRPPRIGVVFSKLYRGEYFNPFSSPQRVRNSVFRFNEWAKSKNIEFRIKVNQGDFFLTGPHETGVSCIPGVRPKSLWQAKLKIFRSLNGARSFTSSDLARQLNITQRSALGILKRALTSRKIEKIDSGKNTRYIFFSGKRRTADAA